jgi:hypothetical protein
MAFNIAWHFQTTHATQFHFDILAQPSNQLNFNYFGFVCGESQRAGLFATSYSLGLTSRLPLSFPPPPAPVALAAEQRLQPVSVRQ